MKPTLAMLIAELRTLGFDGTVDRLERGIITEEQARAELEGKTDHMRISESGLPNPADFAAELKGKGVGRQESWSRWVQRTRLKPGMDAAKWYGIYESVSRR